MKRQLQIASACDEIKTLLIDKNLRYGDSALNPVRIFSKSDAVEQILVRIDDKLSRIQRGAGLIASDEDVVNDLIGYLILLKIALKENIQPEHDSITGSFFTSRSEYDNILLRNNSDSINRNDVWDGADIDSPFDFYIDTINSRSPD